MNVTIKGINGVVKVSTVARYGGGVAIRGLHEEYIRIFHDNLFRNLGISDTDSQNVIIEQSS